MLAPRALRERLKQVFNEQQATVLSEVFIEAYDVLVKTGDFSELKEIVKDLAEAQQRSEQRLSRLEVVVTGLAEAQQRTEETLQELIQEHRETRRQLGGLAMTVGYRLEDAAFKALPKLLKRDFGISLKGRLKRQYVTDNRGREIEVNILGEGIGEKGEVMIVGEAKSQLSKKDIDSFVRRKLERLEGVYAQLFPILITYMTTASDVEAYAQQKDIALYYSYDL